MREIAPQPQPAPPMQIKDHKYQNKLKMKINRTITKDITRLISKLIGSQSFVNNTINKFKRKDT